MAKQAETNPELETRQVWDDEPDDVALTNVLTDLGGETNAEVKVYRAGKGYHGKLSYLFTCRPEEFNLDVLRDEYEGGEFRIHVKKDGRFVEGGNRGIFVEPPRKPKVPEAMESVKSLAEVMEKGFTGIAQLLMERERYREPPPQVNPSEMMQANLTMIAQLMGVLQQMQPPRSDPTDAILKGIELAREFGTEKGESSTTDWLIELTRTFGGPIVQMATKAASEMPNQITPPKVPAIPGQPFPQPAQQPKGAAQAMELVKAVKFLLGKAKQNRDPELYADLILDQVEPEILQAFLGAPDWFQKIKAMVPEVGAAGEWFHSLRESVLEGLTEDGATDIEGTSARQPENLPPVSIARVAGVSGNETDGDPSGTPER